MLKSSGPAVSALSAVLFVSAVAFPNPACTDTANPLTELIDTAAQRLQIAEPVAAFKWKTQAPVEDPTRVREQLATLAAEAVEEDVEPDYVTRVFADQIAATEALEYDRFAQWKLDPSGAPSTAPELSASRAVSDTLDHVMVAQIGLQWDLLHSPECASRLEFAKRDISAARQLDALYQRALSFATQSYCRP